MHTAAAAAPKLGAERSCSACFNKWVATCCVCMSSDELHGGDIVCDGCSRGYHLQCCKLNAFPAGRWYCFLCKTLYAAMKADLEP